jgi:hypothetical protein
MIFIKYTGKIHKYFAIFNKGLGDLCYCYQLGSGTKSFTISTKGQIHVTKQVCEFYFFLKNLNWFSLGCPLLVCFLFSLACLSSLFKDTSQELALCHIPFFLYIHSSLCNLTTSKTTLQIIPKSWALVALQLFYFSTQCQQLKTCSELN